MSSGTEAKGALPGVSRPWLKEGVEHWRPACAAALRRFLGRHLRLPGVSCLEGPGESLPQWLGGV